MNKELEQQVVRQVQQTGNRFSVCLSPKVRESLGLDKGDNVSFEIDPDSGAVTLSKVAQVENNPDDEHDDEHDEIFGLDEVDQDNGTPQDGPIKIDFCPNCGTNDIKVTGSECYCYDCRVVYDVTSRKATVVEMKLTEKLSDFERRLIAVEQVTQPAPRVVAEVRDEDEDEDESESSALYDPDEDD